MSDRAKKVQAYYERGLWSKVRVRNAVVKGWISETEYAEITGEKY